MPIAIVREVSRSVGHCELMHLDRSVIDVERAMDQHGAYCRTLERLGCKLVTLREEPDLPDSVFVEDTAVVVDEVAVLTRPGAVSRRPEVDLMAETLRSHRPLVRIEGPATLDGGDVMRIGKTLFVGGSSRSCRAGIEQLREHVRPYGYEVVAVPVTGCLHLKTAVTQIGDGLVLANQSWFDGAPLRERGIEIVDVHEDEPYGGNALLVAESVVYREGFPRTADRLADRGLEPHLVPACELAKAEGGLTCSSILLA